MVTIDKALKDIFSKIQPTSFDNFRFLPTGFFDFPNHGGDKSIGRFLLQVGDSTHEFSKLRTNLRASQLNFPEC
jgi:hypothetical protein